MSGPTIVQWHSGKIGAFRSKPLGNRKRSSLVLDIAFREDESRVRSGHTPENLAVLRHIALNLYILHTSAPKLNVEVLYWCQDQCY